ncbi:MAG: ATP-binding cassette domain-containing protein [Methanobacteriaceae archaeon]|jgi:ABC-2 type transport system ATP-binding protein|nr:ATP-binding cassette domain-containing protein [Candidatus Methanorudis spinitermitis]
MDGEDEFAVFTSNLIKKLGNFIAVNNLNLKVKRGEIYGLLGPNGAGKTTTIKLLCNLTKPNGGKGHLLGKKFSDNTIASNIGYMPQETALYDGLTVYQNILFFGEVYGLSSKKIRNRSDELLKFINLEKWRDELVENLSGGMKHRLSLACTLIHEPKLLFLDEPTVGVDPELKMSFWNYFYKLKSMNTTILITTHYMEEAHHCDRVGFMKDGGLITEGSPTELLHQTNTDSLEDAFIKFSLGR